MSDVIVISYLFDLIGGKQESHTEIRAYGFDWWFEKNGAKCIPSYEKQNDPSWGYTLDRKIRHLLILFFLCISYQK